MGQKKRENEPLAGLVAAMDEAEFQLLLKLVDSRTSPSTDTVGYMWHDCPMRASPLSSGDAIEQSVLEYAANVASFAPSAQHTVYVQMDGEKVRTYTVYVIKEK